MAGNLASLLSPWEKLEHSARVYSLVGGELKEYVALVVAHDQEGALIILDDGPFPTIRTALPLFREVVTRTTQLQEHAGFQCDFSCASESATEVLSISVGDVEVLHGLLHAVKRYIALADDLHLHSRGRSHQWVAKYKPQTIASSCKSEVARSSPTPSEMSTSPGRNAYLSQAGAEKDQVRRGEMRNDYLHQTLRDRRKEYIDSHDITIKCSTWNMAGKDIAESLTTLLKDNTEDEPSIYCTAFQEMDLRAEAYLTTTDTKAQNYQAYIEGAIGDYYELLASHQLVGMLLCVYAHKSIIPTISNVIKSYVPCGILGMIGNKGAVGIKFDVMNTAFAVVNCHLAAGQGGSDKRNADLKDIEKRIFNDSGIWHSGLDGIDNIIILGDLNYRIQASRPQVDDLLAAKDLAGLHALDQLTDQRRQGNVLTDWHEGDIKFLPTYKYDPGTDLYDTSEKQRIPSWTDRILHKSLDHSMHLVENSYRSISEYYQSDHKPVVATYKATVDIILADKRDAIRNEIFKEFDRYENDARPNIKPKLGEDQLDFGQICYARPVSRTFSISNSGSSANKFNFSHEHKGGQVCNPWFWIVPSFGTLLPKHEAKIQVTSLVDDKVVAMLNGDPHSFRDILVLHVEGGIDSYISLDGEWQKTCLGQNLDVLSQAQNVRNFKDSSDESQANAIPQVIHRICDYLLHQTGESRLFTCTTTRKVLNAVQDALDTNQDFDGIDDAKQITVALCSLLISILATLKKPIVPRELYTQVMKGEAPANIMDKMPSLNLNVLIYLKGFMSALMLAHPEDLRLRDRLCRVFGQALIRQDDETADEGQSLTRKMEFVGALISEY